MDNLKFVETYKNRLTKDIFFDIPSKIMERLEAVNADMPKNKGLSFEIEPYVNDLIVSFINIDDEKFIPPQVSKQNMDRHRMNRNYHIKKIYSDFMNDKQAYEEQRGEMSKHTPFCTVKVMSALEKCDEDKLVNDYIKKVGDWHLHITNRRSAVTTDWLPETIDKHVTLISDYPFFSLYRPRERMNCLRLDIQQCLILLINLKKYKKYAMLHLAEIDNKGLFFEAGLHKYNIARTTSLLSSTVTREGTITASLKQMELGSRSLHKHYAWDEKDSVMINYLCTKIFQGLKHEQISEKSTVSNDFSTGGKLIEICHLLWPNRTTYTVKQYERAYEMIMNLAGVEFIYKDENGGTGSYVIFDEVFCDLAEKIYSVNLGLKMAKNLLEQTFTTILMSQYEALENSIAKVIYQTIKKDRFYDLLAFTNGSVYHKYTFEALMLMVRTTGTKKEKKAKYVAAFQELVNKQILVKTIDVTNNGELYMVEWIKINKNEMADLLIDRHEGTDVADVDPYQQYSQYTLEL